MQIQGLLEFKVVEIYLLALKFIINKQALNTIYLMLKKEMLILNLIALSLFF